jgi:hypothetical protein
MIGQFEDVFLIRIRYMMGQSRLSRGKINTDLQCPHNMAVVCNRSTRTGLLVDSPVHIACRGLDERGYPQGSWIPDNLKGSLQHPSIVQTESDRWNP